MQHAPTSENQFVVELLTTLRNDGFSPFAWWRFLVRSWEMSCETAAKNPTLQCSWVRVTILMGVLTLAILVVTRVFEGTMTLLHLLPGLLFCIIWQQSDLFWHLGLNRHANGALFPTVGLANILTGMRGLAASYLIGRLVGGLPTSSTLALGVFLVGVVTDILDGQVARHTHTQSKLGQIADGETDFCLYLALTIILVQNNVLPLWSGIVMLVRFLLPLIAALASYFLFAHPVRFGSTVWGKYAGLAQCLYFFVLLAPVPLQPLAHIINLPLLIVTLALLIIAPVVQIASNLREK